MSDNNSTAQGLTGIYGHHALVLDVEEGSVKTYFNGELMVNLPLPQPRWIPISERLPEVSVEVFCRWEYPNPAHGAGDARRELCGHTSGFIDGGGTWYTEREYLAAAELMHTEGYRVTHWMPIPPLAEEP